MWLPTQEWLLLVCVVFMLPSQNLSFSSFRPWSGLGNYPAVGIWLAQANRSLLCGGSISPCSIVVLTSTQVLLKDGANCRVQVREVLHCRCERTQTQQAQYNKFGKKNGLKNWALVRASSAAWQDHKGVGWSNAWRRGKILSSGLVRGWILLLLGSPMLHGESFQES